VSQKKRKSHYVVVKGTRPGLYARWEGQGGAAEQVKGFQGAIYKGFFTLSEAATWLQTLPLALRDGLPADLTEILTQASSQPSTDGILADQLASGKIVIFTDGGVINNPGPGGYGVVLRTQGGRRELSGGFRRSTNNRMELWACIEGLRALKEPSSVVLYSDSKYVVNGISKGWVERWHANGWMRDNQHPVENSDLWQELMTWCNRHDVEFRWVRGHAGNPDNERCDQLASKMALSKGLPPDKGFENRA
jgi:ribonuclease HI